MTVDIKMQIQQLMAFEKVNQADRETALRDNFRDISISLLNPMISSLATPLKNSPIKEVILEVERQRELQIQEGGADVHDARFRGVRNIARSALDLSNGSGFLNQEKLKSAFQPIMLDSDEKQNKVTQYLEYLIAENTKLQDHNLCVVSTLHRIMEYRVKEKDRLNIDTGLIIDSLYESATAYPEDGGEPRVMHPYSCHPGAEERLLDLVAVIASQNVNSEDLPIESLVHKMIGMSGEVAGNGAKLAADLGENLTRHVSYMLKQKLAEEEGRALLEEVESETEVPLLAHQVISCYKRQDDGTYIAKDDASIVGYSEELPGRFEELAKIAEWAQDKKRQVKRKDVCLRDADALAKEIADELLCDIAPADLTFMMMPFITDNQSGEDVFRLKVEEYIEGAVRDLVSLEDEIDADEPTTSIMTEATATSLKAYRGHIVKKLWVDEVSGLDGFPFTIEDISGDDQEGFANALSQYNGINPEFYTPSLGNKVLIASKLVDSPSDDIRNRAKTFMNQVCAVANIKVLEALCETLRENGQISVIDALCKYVVDSGVKITKDHLLIFIGVDFTPFSRLISKMDAEEVKQFFLSKNVANKLHDAVKYSRAEYVALMVDTASQVLQPEQFLAFLNMSNERRKLLHEAARSGSPEIVRHILKIAQKKLNQDQFYSLITEDGGFGVRILQYAASRNARSVRFILDISKEVLREDQFIDVLTQTNDNYDTALTYYKLAHKSVGYIIEAAQCLNDGQLYDFLTGVGLDGIALHRAASDNPESLKHILEIAKKKFNDDQFYQFITQRNASGELALHYAARRNSNSLKLLLENTPEDKRTEVIFSTNKDKETALHVASYRLESVEQILEVAKTCLTGDEFYQFITQKNARGELALHCAARENPNSLKLLLENTPEDKRIEVICSTNQAGNSALLIAINRKHVETITAILETVPEDERVGIIQSVIGGSDVVLSAYKANKLGSVFLKPYVTYLAQEGKLSLWDRVYLFFTGNFRLAFSFPKTKIAVTPIGASNVTPKDARPAEHTPGTQRVAESTVGLGKEI